MKDEAKIRLFLAKKKYPDVEWRITSVKGKLEVVGDVAPGKVVYDYQFEKLCGLFTGEQDVDAIPVTNSIEAFFNCSRCLQEMPQGETPGDYQKICAGWTEKGIQIWCVRHDINIAHIDFLGQQIILNTKIATVEDMH